MEESDNSEKDQLRLQLRLKKNRSELVEELILALSDDSETHLTLSRFLAGVKNDILETGDNESGHRDILLNVAYDDILNMRDTILDQIECHQENL